MATPERLKPSKGLMIGFAISAIIWIGSVVACTAVHVEEIASLRSQESYSAYRSTHTEEAARLARGQ